MQSVLVTGSNRGLGLEWVKQYAQLGWRVYATCRFPEQADDLQRLAMLHDTISIHQLDVTSKQQLDHITQQLDGYTLDLLINNAGTYFEQWGKDRLGMINYANWLETLDVNTLGAMRVTEALRNHLARGDKRLVVAISSHMGSIEDISSPNDYAYRSSKAGLNAAMKALSYELASYQIGVLLLHPGWVRTRMGGDSAPLTPQQSVYNMRILIDRFTLKKSGRFYRYDGTLIPW